MAASPGAAPDLPSLARELRRAHDAAMSGRALPPQVRPVVARSWRRMLALGLDPDAGRRSTPLTVGDLDQRRHASRLRLVVDDLRSVLASAADASHYLVVVADTDGVILWRFGSPQVRRQADQLGFAEGATWTEREVGTNAIGTVLAESASVQLFSAEHFESAQIPWYCTAAPIHDPCDGSLLGVVDVSGPALSLHPAITALVGTAVQLAEATLWRRHGERLEALRGLAAPLLAGSADPALVVDDHGWVAARHGVAPERRIAAPVPGRPLQVAGLGLCVPERLGDGWLIRGPGEADRVTLHLDLASAPAMLRVEGGAEVGWRGTVTPRHAQILQALAAHPGGLTAEGLSRVLFGDAEHRVSARAEVSRLRKSLGALVSTNPYRLADGVGLQISGPGPAGRAPDPPSVQPPHG